MASKEGGRLYACCIYRPEHGEQQAKVYLADYVDRGEQGQRRLRALSDRRLLYCEDCGEVMVLH